MTGYNEGEEMKIGISTHNGQYWLKNAAMEYRDIYQVLQEKINLTKMVYVCLSQVSQVTYDELIENLTNSIEHSEFSEQNLLNCGQFIVNQIVSYEKEAFPDEETILHSPALNNLAINSNAGFKATKTRKQRNERKERREKTKENVVIMDKDYSSDSGKY